MSLPTAPKDVSDHPVKGSVTDPVNKDKLHADVDRKLRFYGVIEAFRVGRMPDNVQIDETLQYVLDHSPVKTDELSPAGHKLVNDVKEIIATARKIVKEKNADELFQNFVWHTRAVDLNTAKTGKSPPVTSAQAKADGKQATQHLRTLLSLVLTNGEARKLFSDFSLIGRDLLARTATHIGPGKDELARVDEPAPDEHFVARGESGLPKSEEDKAQRAREATDQATSSARDTASDARKTTQDTSADANDVAAVAQKQKASFKDRITGRVPQERRDQAGDQFNRAKRFLNEEYFPEERRERFIYRGKKVIIECQKHNDYKESITWLLDTLDKYGEHGKTASKEHGKNAKSVFDDPALKQSKDELLTLLSRFANDTSTKPVRESVEKLYDDARKDEELRAWFGKVDKWVRKVLLEPGYVVEKQCNEDGVAVREEGRKFFDDKYKGDFDRVFDVVGDWFSAFTHDPLNKQFGEDWSRLTHDLLFAPDGSLTWKPELWADIRKVVIPQLVDKVGYIPIPRAEYTDDNLDLVVENLTLSGRNLFPNIVSMEAHNFVKFSPYKTIKDESRHDFKFTLGQMQADMRDVMFYFNKKSGMPKLKDSGLADIVIGGEGITATVHLKGAGADRTSVFHVTSVSVKVDSLKFSIRDSKHDALYKVLRPLATGLVKKQVQRALRDALRTGLELVDQQLVKVRDRMEEAKTQEDGPGRVEVLKDLFKKQSDEASQKAKEGKEKRHSQFKVVGTRDSVLLPEQGNPQGWVNKQQEKHDKAKEGHEWRSKAFTIVPQPA